MPFILLLGGARSGKSALATEIAARSDCGVTLIATAEPLDAEMAERIARHRAQRPATWTTVEAPLGLLESIGAAGANDLLLVDCLTLWVSNLMGDGHTEEAIVTAATQAAARLASRPAGAVVISNEVGLGIVPDNPLGRQYRDALGRVNQVFASRAARTALVVGGRLHELTSASDFVEGIQWRAP
jgi:adenosyl cobinamide kinase/adenosyl cobinamide phosphate guanylyltransferase